MYFANIRYGHKKTEKLLKFFVMTVLAVLLSLPLTAVAEERVSSDGYCNGILMCGKVRIVDWNGDIKVAVSNNFPDLDVKVVQSFPSRVGEWQFVTYGEDFTVEFVDNFPDLYIRYVENFPGVH